MVSVNSGRGIKPVGSVLGACTLLAKLGIRRREPTNLAHHGTGGVVFHVAVKEVAVVELVRETLEDKAQEDKTEGKAKAKAVVEAVKEVKEVKVACAGDGKSMEHAGMVLHVGSPTQRVLRETVLVTVTKRQCDMWKRRQ